MRLCRNVVTMATEGQRRTKLENQTIFLITDIISTLLLQESNCEILQFMPIKKSYFVYIVQLTFSICNLLDENDDCTNREYLLSCTKRT